MLALELADLELELSDSSADFNTDPIRIGMWVRAFKWALFISLQLYRDPVVVRGWGSLVTNRSSVAPADHKRR